MDEQPLVIMVCFPISQKSGLPDFWEFQNFVFVSYTIPKLDFLSGCITRYSCGAGVVGLGLVSFAWILCRFWGGWGGAGYGGVLIYKQVV